MKSKVSVVVNCFNGAKFLEDAINSILNQKYSNLEIIFWDNNSSDDSKKKILKFKDKRIKAFFSKKHRSLYEARNLAIKNCSGDFISFLDCDDWWHKNNLFSRKEFFKNSKYAISFCNKKYFFEKNKKYKLFKKQKFPNGNIYDFLARDYIVTISGLVIRREILSKIGYFNSNYNIIGDYDWVMRVTQQFLAHSISKPMLFSRVHQDNFSKNTRLFSNEYKHWYDNLDLKNNLIKKNIYFFKTKLDELQIIDSLINKKNMRLFINILSFPIWKKKFFYFILFFFPKKLLIFLKK